MLTIRKTALPGVLVVEPKVFRDRRGSFFESWRQSTYSEIGIEGPFVQDNVSRSARGVLRGLHFQHPNGQGKLVQVLSGEVFDVAVDVRIGSPTFGQWTAITLSEEKVLQFWIPAGFAHGFCVTSDSAIFVYKCTDYYVADSEHTVRWNDPDIGIEWPLEDPQLSDKDRSGTLLREFDAGQLPRYED